MLAWSMPGPGAVWPLIIGAGVSTFRKPVHTTSETVVPSRLLLATGTRVFRVDPDRGTLEPGEGLIEREPTSLAVDPHDPGRAWCGTRRAGVFRSEDGGRSWGPTALRDVHVTSLAASPGQSGLLWAGTEPSALWRSPDGGDSWTRTEDLTDLPSSSEWSFPPKPDTHHVRWIACHPLDPGLLWLAIEAGALIRTSDGGRTWSDRVGGGPRDTHEAAIHPDRPETIRVAAGDGYFESHDQGATWITPDRGLEVGYFRSVAMAPDDPGVVVLSGASTPRTTYAAGHSDGRLYRRQDGSEARWERVNEGWPDPPTTIAPLLRSGRAPGEFWAADERGIHRSGDGGHSWSAAASFADEGRDGPEPPHNLRGFALLP